MNVWPNLRVFVR